MPSALTTTPNANLTLQAGRSIAINNSVATNGSGNITMVANNTDNSETNAAGGALVGSGGTNRSAGAASLTVSGAISTRCRRRDQARKQFRVHAGWRDRGRDRQ
jgi:hypothetical protein